MSASKCSGFGWDFFSRKLVCPSENHIAGLMAKRMNVHMCFIRNERKNECTIAQEHLLYCEENIFILVLLISEQFHNTACVSRDKSSFKSHLKIVVS